MALRATTGDENRRRQSVPWRRPDGGCEVEPDWRDEPARESDPRRPDGPRNVRPARVSTQDSPCTEPDAGPSGWPDLVEVRGDGRGVHALLRHRRGQEGGRGLPGRARGGWSGQEDDPSVLDDDRGSGGAWGVAARGGLPPGGDGEH